MKFVIASSNLHKVREMRSMLKEFSNIEFLSLRDFPDYIAPEETGTTFKENAEIKASHAAKHLDCIAIGDDSGLVVPALNGEPGVYSARYAGVQANDQENREKLIGKLKSLPHEKRVGYFECCIAVATKDGIKKSVCGNCEGELLDTPRGSQGFGYDSIFLKHNYRKTFAELESDTKNRISHRRKALDKLETTLYSLSR
ncbi:non-canonical purine NTP pyrophosphatase [Candidatus Aerophobetes bacterium]|uniref:dITP/XTP pyrophosphatase n=1 Tax=Aerophobetes bacterium TaxID=2030807 RepID=A0A2A4YHN5_UNCAE|nr:MAG: non-canonical purine NTP pyrophosphatase [Candidatus Aerophobetes bacterium]